MTKEQAWIDFLQVLCVCIAETECESAREFAEEAVYACVCLYVCAQCVIRLDSS